ncbi:MAG: hypothetical protein ACM3S1_09160 [Hyphomicrobiales bacterium]
MNDAIALLAGSQLVCLGALGYLYMEIQRLRKDARPRRAPVHPRAAVQQAARQAYATSTRQAGSAFGRDAASIAARMNDLGVDIPALARRMNRSEEEVRLLLRRQGVVR